MELLKSWDISKLSFSERNEDARYVISQIKQQVHNPHYKVISEIDSEGNLQAICTYRICEDHIYIALLATAPWNLLADHPLKTKGGPTRLINRLVELYGLPITLVSLGSSEGFYQKLGFRYDSEDGRYWLDIEPTKSYNKKVHPTVCANLI